MKCSVSNGVCGSQQLHFLQKVGGNPDAEIKPRRHVGIKADTGPAATDGKIAGELVDFIGQRQRLLQRRWHQ